MAPGDIIAVVAKWPDACRARSTSSARPRLPERIAARIQLLLASVPDPDAAALHLERLRQRIPFRLRPHRQLAGRAALRRSTSSPTARFSPRPCCKNPERILQVANSGSFYRVLSAEEYEERLFEFLGAGPPGRAFRRWTWRASAAASCCASCCATCWAWPTLSDVTEELSNLADAILDFTYRRIRDEFVARHGEPRLADGSPCAASP